MMHENLGNNALKALESGQFGRILPALDALKKRGSTAEVLGMFDSLTAHLSNSKDQEVRNAIVSCLKTHANRDAHIMSKTIAWADTILGVPRESVDNLIQRAEAAHLIGRLDILNQAGSTFGSMGDKLLELAKDSNEDVEVRRRCIQSLGRIKYTAAWSGLNSINKSLADETLLQELSIAIETLRQRVCRSDAISRLAFKAPVLRGQRAQA